MHSLIEMELLLRAHRDDRLREVGAGPTRPGRPTRRR